MPDFLGKIYREQCYSEEKDKKVKEMCENIKDSYRELISEADWLSEDGRSKMLSKLENIEFRTGGVMKNTFVSPDIIETPGIISDIVDPLRENEINIVEIISSQTAVVLFVNWDDGEKAHKLIKEVLE